MKEWRVYGGGWSEGGGRTRGGECGLKEKGAGSNAGIERNTCIQSSHSVLRDVGACLFSAPTGQALAHCVNSDLAMGAGIAKQFIARWPALREGYRSSRPGSLHLYNSERGLIFNLITKEKYSDKPSLASPTSSLTSLKSCLQARSLTSLAVPELGSGRDMLDAGEVRGALLAVFRDSDIQVTMYHLPAGARENFLKREASRDARRKVKFQLTRNTMVKIPPLSILGLNLPTVSKKKKMKEPENVRDVSKTSRLVEGEGQTPWEKLARMRKQLGKLEAGEGRLEGRGEERVGREEREERREGLREEIGRIESRIALFN